MQFYQRRPVRFTKVANFLLKVRNTEINFRFCRKIFVPQTKFPMDSSKAVFLTPRERLGKMPRIVQSMSNSVEKNKSFQKTIYLICSYAHEESVFDYPAETFFDRR